MGKLILIWTLIIVNVNDSFNYIAYLNVLFCKFVMIAKNRQFYMPTSKSTYTGYHVTVAIILKFV